MKASLKSQILLPVALFLSMMGFTNCSAEEGSQTFSNSVKGMLLLSAYGDALGAPHEMNGMRGQVIDPGQLAILPSVETVQPLHKKAHGWGVWADGKTIQGRRAIPTDDTAFRLMVLSPWLLQTQNMSDDDFQKWLVSDKKNAGHLKDSVTKSYQEHIDGWKKMYKAEADHPQKATIYFSPGDPVMFGLFQYITLAPLYADCDKRSLYRHFRDFSALDQGYGRVVTGVMMAAAADISNDHLSEDKAGKALLERLQKFANPAWAENDQERRDLEIVQKAVQAMDEFGMTHRYLMPQKFVSVFRDKIYNHRTDYGVKNHSMNNCDPLLMLMQITAALSYSHDKPLEALRLLAAGPGDADTTTSLLGAMLGSAIGEESLKDIKIGQTKLNREFNALSKTVRYLFDTDFDRQTDTYQKARAKTSCPKP